MTSPIPVLASTAPMVVGNLSPALPNSVLIDWIADCSFNETQWTSLHVMNAKFEREWITNDEQRENSFPACMFEEKSVISLNQTIRVAITRQPIRQPTG